MFVDNIMAERETLSFEKAHTQLEEHIIFQHNAKVENRGSLAHNDDQKQEKEAKDAKYSNAMLEEVEMKTIEYFLSPTEELEQKKNLMTKSSNKTIESCGFTTEKLCVNVGILEDKPSNGTVLNEAKICQAKYDDDYLSDEDQIELRQQKEFINSLFNKGIASMRARQLCLMMTNLLLMLIMTNCFC